MRLFLTHILTESLINKHKLSFAACNFSFNLISGGGFDKVYSTMGTYVGDIMEDIAYTDSRYNLVYNQFLRTKGKIGRILASIFEQIKIFHYIPRGSSLWLYNISSLNTILYILLRLFKPSVQINVIELDFTPPTNKICINSLFLKLMNGANGIIKLADSQLFTNRNSICLAGVTPKNSGSEPLITKPNKMFLISGVLQNNISSLPMILEAFSQVPECILHITGNYDNMSLINSYIKKYPNIIYHGILSYSDYIELLHSVTFQMSLRNPLWKDNNCNFPSKIIEALLHNRIVISTISYKQIDGLQYIKTECSVTGFIKTLKKILIMSDEELINFANQGKKTSELFSPHVWNKYMNKIEINFKYKK